MRRGCLEASLAIDWMLWIKYGKQDLSAVIFFALFCYFLGQNYLLISVRLFGRTLGFLFPVLLLLLRLDALGLWEDRLLTKNATAWGVCGGKILVPSR